MPIRGASFSATASGPSKGQLFELATKLDPHFPLSKTKDGWPLLVLDIKVVDAVADVDEMLLRFYLRTLVKNSEEMCAHLHARDSNEF